MKKLLLSASVLLCAGLMPLALNAQDLTGQVPAVNSDAQTLSEQDVLVPIAPVASTTQVDLAQMSAAAAPAEGAIKVDIPSILFTYWEYTAIIDAKNARGTPRGVTEEELRREMEKSLKPEEERIKPPPEERDISLGGIAYTTKKDWTIWLNGQRITPDAMPKEIIDLQVYRHYVDMKWMDDYTLRVYPIRLRAHQRFNLDSRIFLPG